MDCFGVQSVDTVVGRCTTSYLLARPSMFVFVTPCSHRDNSIGCLLYTLCLKCDKHDNSNTQQLPKNSFSMLVHMPEVIRTKNSLLLLLLSIHFYEKVGNVELEPTAQIIFTCLLLSRSLLLLMNELQCYSLSASSSKRYDTCFFIQPALLKFETIH